MMDFVPTDPPPSGLELPQAAAISPTVATNMAVALRACRRSMVIAADTIATVRNAGLVQCATRIQIIPFPALVWFLSAQERAKMTL